MQMQEEMLLKDHMISSLFNVSVDIGSRQCYSLHADPSAWCPVQFILLLYIAAMASLLSISFHWFLIFFNALYSVACCVDVP